MDLARFSRCAQPLRLVVMLILALLGITHSRVLAATAPPLGSAAPYAVLADNNVNNAASATLTVVNGDLGAGGNVNGFPPGTVNGTLSAPVAAGVLTDMTTAYNNALGQTITTDLSGQDLSGLTLTPGVYGYDTSAQMSSGGTLTFDAQGNANAVFIINVGTSLTIQDNAVMTLINGARACNVFWAIGTAATLNKNDSFIGTLMTKTTISLNDGTQVNGRLWAGTNVTLNNNVIGLPCLGLSIVKKTNNTDNNTAPGPSLPVGSTVTWTYIVTNPGNVPLMNITVTDDQGVTPVYVSGDANTNSLLDPGETWLYQATGLATAGQYANIGTATGSTSGGTEVHAHDSDHYLGTEDPIAPDVTVTKEADTKVTKVGDSVCYTVTITNNGGVPVDITKVEDSLVDLPQSVLDQLLGTIPPGDSVDAMYCYTVQPKDDTDYDPTDGQYICLVNTVTIYGCTQEDNGGGVAARNSVDGCPEIGSATAEVKIVHPCIKVIKWTNACSVEPGKTMYWYIKIENCGDWPVENIEVSDPKLGGLLEGFPEGLDPGECRTVCFSYRVPCDACGCITNTVCVRANPVDLPNILTATGTATVRVCPPQPKIGVRKWASCTTAMPGDVIRYTISVKNLGCTPLTGVQVRDDMLGGLLCGFKSTLQPGECSEKQFCYRIPECAPSCLENTAMARGKGPDNCYIYCSDSVTVRIIRPCIGVRKRASCSVAIEGETIWFTISVKNLGDTPLTNVQVEDPMLGGILPGFPSTLVPGQVCEKRFRYCVPEDSITCLVNTVTVKGKALNRFWVSDTACARVRIIEPVYQPDLIIHCQGNVATIGNDIYATYTDQSLTHNTCAGTPLVYEITLENDGNYTDSYKVRASCNTTSPDWEIRYYSDRECLHEITPQITGSSGWIVRNVPCGRSTICYAVVTPCETLPVNAYCTIYVKAWSLCDTTKIDMLRACTKIGEEECECRPDLLIRARGSQSCLGNNIYNTTGDDQTLLLPVSNVARTVFELRLENDGDTPCCIRLKGDAAPTGWQAAYFTGLSGGTDITGEITGPGLLVSLDPGQYVLFRLIVLPGADIPADTTACFRVRACKNGSSSICDQVVAVAQVE